ncbi:MAG: serine/threonine-protein kinase [Acidobacteriota bacterium]
MKKVGKYELGEELGRGAMGIVYKAHDTLLNREVALKIMIHADQNSSESKRRFYWEAQSAGSLMHDNIVKVFDLGEDNSVPYIVMEYLPGHDLKELMLDGKLGSYRDQLKIWMQICKGLHHAHRRGLVHRDIKPGNIRITSGNRVKIMDFGIAKKPSSDLTQTGVVLGTVDYMAPEQVKGLGADSRSDLFSMGVMFYEMLTLRKPFPGDSVTSIIYKIVYEEPEPMDPMVVICPPDIQRIIQKLLAKVPQDRYQSAVDVARDLKLSYEAWKGAGEPLTAAHGSIPAAELHATVEASAGAVSPPLPAAAMATIVQTPPPMAAQPPPPAPAHLAATVVRSAPPPAAPPPPQRPAIPVVPVAPAAPARDITLDDLPIHRPDVTVIQDVGYQPPMAPASARGGRPSRLADVETLVDLDDARPPAGAPEPRRFPMFWVLMAVLFVITIAAGALFVKMREKTTVAGTPTPTLTEATPAVGGTPTPVAIPTGQIRVETNLPADIQVDGKAVGVTPLSEPVAIPIGKHQLTLRELKFGVTLQKDIEIKEGEAQVLKMPFEGEGFVAFRIKPWAFVVIDGNKKGKIEVQAAHPPIPLPAGKHTFDLENPAKKTTREDYVVPGKTVEIEVDLTTQS